MRINPTEQSALWLELWQVLLLLLVMHAACQLLSQHCNAAARCMLLYGSSFAIVLYLVALFFMPLDAVQPCLGCDARLYAMCFIHRPVTSAVKVYKGCQQHVASCIGAGVTSTVTCFPLDVMRTRVMGPGGHVYGGVLSTFRNLLQKEGISSLYVGLLPAVISMAPAGAVFYGVYDLLKVPFRLHHAH